MSDTVALAIIANVGSWIKEFGVWLSIIGGIFGTWAWLKSIIIARDMKAQKEELKCTAAALIGQADATQAMALHAQSEMVVSREENRKMYDFVETNTFMVDATTPGDSGRPALKPLSDFGDIYKG